MAQYSLLAARSFFMNSITSEQILTFCDNPQLAKKLSQEINAILATNSGEKAWEKISKHILTPLLPFEIYMFFFIFCLLSPHGANCPTPLLHGSLMHKQSSHQI